MYVPVQKSRTFFRQNSMFDGKGKDWIGNNAVLAGIYIDSPEQKKTVPDFFVPSQTIKSQRQTKACQNANGLKHDKQPAAIPRLINNCEIKNWKLPEATSSAFQSALPPGGDGRGGLPSGLDT